MNFIMVQRAKKELKTRKKGKINLGIEEGLSSNIRILLKIKVQLNNNIIFIKIPNLLNIQNFII